MLASRTTWFNTPLITSICTFAAAAFIAGCSSGCSTTEKPASSDTPAAKGETQTQQTGEVNVEPTVERPVVVMETSMGPIEIELYSDKAPISTANFLKYVDDGHYNGTIFHRVIENFMIQGGGFTPEMKEKGAGKPIKNEADNGIRNKRGTLAMARTMVVDSATAQFFINVKDNTFLDHRDKSMQGYGYAVFGEVKKGMDVVDKIKGVRTGPRPPHDDVPLEPVVIKSVKRK